MPGVPVTLAEAVERRVVACSLDSLRRASTRDGRFPRPVDVLGAGPCGARLYEPADLVAWERGRPGSPLRLRPSPVLGEAYREQRRRQRGERDRELRRSTVTVAVDR